MRMSEEAGSDPQALRRIQKKVRFSLLYLTLSPPPRMQFKLNSPSPPPSSPTPSEQIDRLSAMDSAAEKGSKKLHKAGIGKK